MKRGVKIAMEEDGRDHASESSALDAMAALFNFLVSNSILSEYQVAKGVSRLRKIQVSSFFVVQCNSIHALV